MTIKVYANYDAEVITKKEFLAKVEELAKEYDEDTGKFETFLGDNYTIMELWDITESEKTKARESFHEENIEKATEDIENDWIETILEI